MVARLVVLIAAWLALPFTALAAGSSGLPPAPGNPLADLQHRSTTSVPPCSALPCRSPCSAAPARRSAARSPQRPVR